MHYLMSRKTCHNNSNNNKRGKGERMRHNIKARAFWTTCFIIIWENPLFSIFFLSVAYSNTKMENLLLVTVTERMAFSLISFFFNSIFVFAKKYGEICRNALIKKVISLLPFVKKIYQKILQRIISFKCYGQPYMTFHILDVLRTDEFFCMCVTNEKSSSEFY